MWNWFVSRVLQIETQGLKYRAQIQRIRHAERNNLVKMTGREVESLIVRQGPRGHKVAFVAQQIRHFAADRRGRAKRKSHSQTGAPKGWAQLSWFQRRYFRLPAVCYIV